MQRSAGKQSTPSPAKKFRFAFIYLNFLTKIQSYKNVRFVPKIIAATKIFNRTPMMQTEQISRQPHHPDDTNF
jgi:hypothetical protein